MSLETLYYHKLGIRKEFPGLNPIAAGLLIAISTIHTIRHHSIIEGYPLPKDGPAILTGNHRANEDNYKLCIAGVNSGRLIRAIIKRGLVIKGFQESDEYLRSIDAEESLKYNPFMAFVLERIGTVPIDREHLNKNLFLRTTDEILKSQILGLFMQPHRYKDGTLQHLQPGAAILAKRHQSVPVFLFASSGEPDGPDKLTILESFTYAQLQADGRKRSAGELTIIMADRIAEALPDGPRNKWLISGRKNEAQRLKVSL